MDSMDSIDRNGNVTDAVKQLWLSTLLNTTSLPTLDVLYINYPTTMLNQGIVFWSTH